MVKTYYLLPINTDKHRYLSVFICVYLWLISHFHVQPGNDYREVIPPLVQDIS